MPIKMMVDDQYVASSLKQLLEWADFIVESLTLDQGYEVGNVESLKRLLGEAPLKDLRQTAWTLREKLYVVAVQTQVRCGPRRSPDRVAKAV